MYIYICIHIHVNLYLCGYIFIYTYVYGYIHMCVHIYTNIYIHTDLSHVSTIAARIRTHQRKRTHMHMLYARIKSQQEVRATALHQTSSCDL